MTDWRFLGVFFRNCYGYRRNARKMSVVTKKLIHCLLTKLMSDILIIQPTSKLDMFSTWWLIRVQAHFKTLVQSGNFSLQHVRNITGWFFKLNFFRRWYKSNNEKTFIAADDETGTYLNSGPNKASKVGPNVLCKVWLMTGLCKF